MTNKETPEARYQRFKAMSSEQRKALIRKKMKTEGLEEGSGVSDKDLSVYDKEEVSNLIRITRCFPEMQSTDKIKRF